MVLFLDPDAANWLTCTPEELIIKKSAYWVCLQGAQDSVNETSQTVYIPKSNLLSPENLLDLMKLAVHKSIPTYQTPNK